jgi:hypothetical protein
MRYIDNSIIIIYDLCLLLMFKSSMSNEYEEI